MDEFAAERDLLRRIRTEGILAAYEAALAVCRDSKAPANARATASGVLFRVAGLFEKRSDDDRGKEAYEMSPDELEREIVRIQRAGKARPSGIFD